MFVHLMQIESDPLTRTDSWCVKSCEYQARKLPEARWPQRPDSLKRSRNLIPSLGQAFEDREGQLFCLVEAADPLDLQAEMVTKDILEKVTPHLNETQCETFYFC